MLVIFLVAFGAKAAAPITGRAVLYNPNNYELLLPTNGWSIWADDITNAIGAIGFGLGSGSGTTITLTNAGPVFTNSVLNTNLTIRTDYNTGTNTEATARIAGDSATLASALTSISATNAAGTNSALDAAQAGDSTVSDAARVIVQQTNWSEAFIGDMHSGHATGQTVDSDGGVIGRAWLEASIGYIISNKTTLNTKIFNSAGDVANMTFLVESNYPYMSNQLQRLVAAGIPVITPAGNHEGSAWISSGNNVDTNWDRFFGPLLAQSGCITSSYGGYRQVYLLQTNSSTKLAWVTSDLYATNRTDWLAFVCTNFPDHLVIALNHINIGSHENRLDGLDSDTSGGNSYQRSKLNLLQNLVQIHGGHMRDGFNGAVMQEHLESGAMPVRILWNTQNNTNTGCNYIRYYFYKPIENWVQARTWENTTAHWTTNGEPAFEGSIVTNAYDLNFGFPIVQKALQQHALNIDGRMAMQRSYAKGPGNWSLTLVSNELADTTVNLWRHTDDSTVDGFSMMRFFSDGAFNLRYVAADKKQSVGSGSNFLSISTSGDVSAPVSFDSGVTTNTSLVVDGGTGNPLRVVTTRTATSGEDKFGAGWVGSGIGSAQLSSGGNFRFDLDDDSSAGSTVPTFQIRSSNDTIVVQFDGLGLAIVSNLLVRGAFTNDSIVIAAGSISGAGNIIATNLTAITQTTLSALDADQATNTTLVIDGTSGNPLRITGARSATSGETRIGAGWASAGIGTAQFSSGGNFRFDLDDDSNAGATEPTFQIRNSNDTIVVQFDGSGLVTVSNLNVINALGKTNFIFGRGYISNNVAPMLSDTNDYVMNAYNTNGASVLFISQCFALTPATITDAAEVGLWFDQDANGTWEQNGISVSEPAMSANSARNRQLSGMIQPGGRFIFTNLSGATATATVKANSVQRLNR